MSEWKRAGQALPQVKGHRPTRSRRIALKEPDVTPAPPGTTKPLTNLRPFRGRRTRVPPDRRDDVVPALERSAAAAPVAASETGAGATAVDRKRPLFPSMAQLLAGHVLRDGEVV